MILAEKLAGDGDIDAAVGFVRLNLEFYPESIQTYVLWAKILNASGDRPGARESLEKALQIEPENQWIRQMLAGLESAG